MVWSLQNNVAFTIENPANSWMWSVFAWLARKYKHSSYYGMKHSLLEVVFDACQHGGTRPKATKLLTNCKLFAALRARCDNNHPHEPWGAQWTDTGYTFATHLEAAYPLLLADRMADLFAKHALAQGPGCSRSSTTGEPPVLALQGRQDRKSPVLIPEFRCIKTLKASQIPTSGVRILTAPMMGVHTGRSKQTLNVLKCNENKVLDDNLNEWDKSELYGRELEVGFYRTPKEWFDQARHLSHPMDVGNPIAAITREALRVNVHEDAKVIELKRKTAILKVQIEAKKLQESETELHSKMPAYMQKVLKGKRILLFESLLRSHGYDDLGVVDFLKRGVDLTGASECPDCFERRVRLASLTRAELVGAAPAMRKSLIASPRVLEPDLQAALLEATDKELELGFLEGPFGCGRRTTTRPWPLRPKKTATSAGRRDLRWVGKCLDLSKAYKQLAVSERDRSMAVILIHATAADGDLRARYYVSNSLMFGAAASVFAFNRVSRSLHFLFNRLLAVPRSVFYDDYPLLSPAHLAEGADRACSQLLDLLGWRHARTGDGDKGLEFSPKFDVLGMSVDLRLLRQGTLVLTNKEGRIERVCEMLKAARHDGSLAKH